MNLNKDCTVVITTFFSGEKLDQCLSSIPENYPIVVIDNGCEGEKKNLYEKKFKNLNYIIPKENLGIPRSYSFALSFVKTRFMFQTQPDVIVKKNCIENLLEASSKYPNAGILTPIIFDNEKYSVKSDYKILKYKNNKLIDIKLKYFNASYDRPPEGDLSVDAVTATAMLIDTDKIKKINDWDKNIFAYYEDMDICLRLRFLGYEILKIKNAEVNHDPFSSHDIAFEEKLDFSRNWHYSWSSFYFFKKHGSLIYAYKFGVFLLISSFFKCLVYFLFNKKKHKTHLSKFLGILNSMLNLKSYFRPNIQNKNF